MNADELLQSSVVELSRGIELGELTSERLTSACIERVREREPEVQAWAYFDADLALETARMLDRTPRIGPLHGIPVAIKDIMDTAQMPTAYGSPIYTGYCPKIDAAPVAAVRAAGGLIFGKAITTEFAHRLPGHTRNPLDLERTPGGSSSGCVAAVADGMAPIALTTQTTASTIRPASFCGLVGYRPSFGIMGLMGVKQSAPAMDTVGIIARTVGDCALMRDVLLEKPTRPPTVQTDAKARIGFCRTPFWDKVEPEARALIEATVASFAAEGAEVRDLDTPDDFAELQACHRRITSYELVRSLTAERREHMALLSPLLREGRMTDGMRVSFEDYIDAVEIVERARTFAGEFFQPYDFVVCPATSGIAPKGLSSTGLSEFCVLWTSLHVPAITVPLSTRIDNMPLGIQLVGRRGHDMRLFDHALWVESRV